MDDGDHSSRCGCVDRHGICIRQKECHAARGTERHESVAEKVPTAEETGVDSSDQYEFLLVDHNDYVAVYQLPEREIYEYTDVIMEVLPEDVQKEVQHGKYIKNEEELYNFLENYTS